MVDGDAVEGKTNYSVTSTPTPEHCSNFVTCTLMICLEHAFEARERMATEQYIRLERGGNGDHSIM